MIRFRPDRTRSYFGPLLDAILVSLIVCIPARAPERLELDGAKQKTVRNGATARTSPIFWLEILVALGTNNLNVGHIGFAPRPLCAILPQEFERATLLLSGRAAAHTRQLHPLGVGMRAK